MSKISKSPKSGQFEYLGNKPKVYGLQGPASKNHPGDGRLENPTFKKL